MHLEHLELQRFRNYVFAREQFREGLNVLHGDNAQGKTNLLEAIFLLSTCRSHRTSREPELIAEGEEDFRILGLVRRESRQQKLEIHFSRDKGKSVFVDGGPERKIASIVGRLTAVLFSPDDLQLIKGPPAARRRFLDIELSQVFPSYLYHLQRFFRVLQQRNTLLREISEGNANGELLDLWDEQLAIDAGVIISRRNEAILRMAVFAAQIHADLTQSREQLSVSYSSPVLSPSENPEPNVLVCRIRDLLMRQRREELRRATTLVGPHRDDFYIRIDGKDAKSFASQGQQRTAVLALKMAELKFMTEVIHEKPILLLDDVVSELDPERRRQLLRCIQQAQQTFLTCTDLSDLSVSETDRVPTQVFHVAAGTLTSLP